MININDTKIPIVIGVTGHRDIAKKDFDALKNQISKIYTYLTVKYPSTPLILLTPLADGADRLVADVALNKNFSDKITTCVPIPMDEEDYKKTFGLTLKEKDKEGNETERVIVSNKDSKEEYDFFMKRVETQDNKFAPTTIPMLFDKEKYHSSNGDEQRIIRHKQYSLVGEYIAIHSQILIALQNPCSEGKDGGTTEIVNKKLTGEYEHITDMLSNVGIPEKGLVYRILTPRLSDKEELNNKYLLSKEFPDFKTEPWKDKDERPDTIDNLKNIINVISDTKEHLFSKPCRTKSQMESMSSFRLEHNRIECLNKLIQKNKKKIVSASKNDIFKYMKNKIIKREFLCNTHDSLLVKNIITRRAAATLSSIYQKKMTSLELPLLLLIALSVSTFFVPAILTFDSKPYVSALYIIIIALFYVLAIYFKKYKYLYEDTRAISEGLRVQIAWKIANINESVAHHYPSAQKNEINWIRTSLRALNVFHLPSEKNIDAKTVVDVNKHWIEEQIKYFKKNIEELSFKSEKQTKIIKYLIYMTLIFGSIISLYTIAGNDISTSNFKNIKFILVSIPIILLAYFKAKESFDGYLKVIKQYKLSLQYFERAEVLIETNKGNNENSANVYRSLGLEALEENTFWTILRREKNYKSPSL